MDEMRLREDPARLGEIAITALSKAGFSDVSLISARSYPDIFGNGTATLMADRVRVSFATDRGNFYAELAITKDGPMQDFAVMWRSRYGKETAFAIDTLARQLRCYVEAGIP